MIDIDDILHPGERARRESNQLGAQIRYLDQLLALLHSAKPAAQDSPRTAMGSENGCHTEPQDCSGFMDPRPDEQPAALIKHAGGGPPRTGINIIRLTDTRCVQAMCTYITDGEYHACEIDYDIGRPLCIGASPLQTLECLRAMLEDELLHDDGRVTLNVERLRDVEFARVLAGARP